MQQQSVKTILTVTAAVLVILVAVAVGGLGWFPAPAVIAQDRASTVALPRTITVIGEGKVRIKPDIARANIGVEVVESTVKEASAQNRQILETVLAALQAQGIDEADIQTSGFSIFAERYGPEGPRPEDQVSYRVSNNVSVVIRDLETVGAVLDAAVEAGANNIYGIEFSLDDPTQVKAEARARAIEDALAKAEDLANLTAVAVGDVVSISEVIGQGGGYYAASFTELNRGLGGGGAGPISPGELDLTMQLQVTYQIAE